MRSRSALAAAIAGLAAVADSVLPRHGYGIALGVFAVAISWLILDGIRRNQPSDRLPWYILAAGQAMSTGSAIVMEATNRPALDLPPASHVLVVGSIVSCILSFGLFVRHRTRVLDRFQLLDLAIFLVSLGAALNELVLGPVLDAKPTNGISPGLSRAYILLVLAGLVLIIRFVTLPGRRGPSVWLLLAVPVSSVVGSVVSNATSHVEGGGWRMAWDMVFAAVCCAAAARHPSMVELTEEPEEGQPRPFSGARVAALGLALFSTSVFTLASYERTGQLHALALLLTSGLLTVLVMTRLRLLFTREQAAQEQLVVSREAFRALVHGISDAIVVIDADGRIGYATGSVDGALRHTPEALVGRELPELFDADAAEQIRAVLAAVVGSGGSGELTVTATVGGDRRVFELEATDRTDNPNLRGVIVVLHEVTDRHVLENELRHQAYHDALTGLPNRTFLSQRVEAMLLAARPISLLFIDLDDFKHVNDGLGHYVGDVLLESVAARLQGAIRREDTIARLGGDEFAVLVADDDPMTAHAAARRILEVMAEPFDVLDHRLTVTVSVGVAHADSGCSSVDDLLRRADVAMYGAKAAGKGTLAVFEQAMSDAATERVSLVSELGNAIRTGELRLLFQPIVSLATHEVRGGEALVRWQHPTFGVLTPDRFIPLAEETGLIVPLGRWVLEEACRQAASWPDEVTVSVNVSARQLEDDEVVNDIAAIIRLTGIAPHRLVLEVTESVVMRDIEPMVQRLDALRSLGVRIAIDDFGTGYSSLASLMRLPIDVLKIDRAFIATMLDHAESSALVHLLIEMGRTLHMEVVAEGVERPEQAEQLRRDECHEGQGFLFARPLPDGDFRSFIAGSRVTARM